jgi:hypothetical protein
MSSLRYALGLQQPTGWWTNGFVYDLARRLTNVSSPAGTFGYTHTSVAAAPTAGALIQTLSLPGGGSITNDLDSLARLRGPLLESTIDPTLDAATYRGGSPSSGSGCTSPVGCGHPARARLDAHPFAIPSATDSPHRAKR